MHSSFWESQRNALSGIGVRITDSLKLNWVDAVDNASKVCTFDVSIVNEQTQQKQPMILAVVPSMQQVFQNGSSVPKIVVLADAPSTLKLQIKNENMITFRNFVVTLQDRSYYCVNPFSCDVRCALPAMPVRHFDHWPWGESPHFTLAVTPLNTGMFSFLSNSDVVAQNIQAEFERPPERAPMLHFLCHPQGPTRHGNPLQIKPNVVQDPIQTQNPTMHESHLLNFYFVPQCTENTDDPYNWAY